MAAKGTGKSSEQTMKQQNAVFPRGIQGDEVFLKEWTVNPAQISRSATGIEPSCLGGGGGRQSDGGGGEEEGRGKRGWRLGVVKERAR